MDSYIIANEVSQMEKNEEVVVCYKDKVLILTHPENKDGRKPVNVIRTIGKNSVKINNKTFIDCDFVYFMQRRPYRE